jgi:hypothetical protein
LAALSVLLPGRMPSVQLVSVAIPLLFEGIVAGEVGFVLPPPLVTVNTTLTPFTGLPNWSRTITAGGVATAVPTVADWPLPAWTAIWVAGPAVAVAVNASGLPLSDPLVTLSVLLFVPAAVPRVQLVNVAIPLAPVASVAGDTGLIDPPPPVTVNVTLTPWTPFPNASCTITDGSTATAVLTVADCPLPPFTAMVAAAAAVMVNAALVALVGPVAVAVRV